MKPAATVAELRSALASRRAGSLAGSVGLVPTMGALHDGHLSLVARARDECDTVAVSIFVNPLQFAPGEDYRSYPRNLAGDLDVLASAGVDVVFTPDAGDLLPPQRLTTVHVERLTATLEGAARPGHFDGVATIVTKLLNVAQPSAAYFGEKDYQQLVVVRRLVADLDFPVTVVACPTVRDRDGLALSSRNAYLNPEQRRRALGLSRTLAAVVAEWDGDADAARDRACRLLEQVTGLRLEYADVVAPDSLAPLHGRTDGEARLLLAATVGGTRLLDNAALPAVAAGAALEPPDRVGFGRDTAQAAPDRRS